MKQSSARLSMMAPRHRITSHGLKLIHVGSFRPSPGITSRSAFDIWPFPTAIGEFEIHLWSAMNASSSFATFRHRSSDSANPLLE